MKFRIDGAALIVGVDNGNPATVESFQGDQRKAFNGLALVIVRGEKDRAGQVKITPTSEGLKAGETVITSRK